MVRVESLFACLLLVAVAPGYLAASSAASPGASPESIPANEHAAAPAKLGAGLAKALAEAITMSGSVLLPVAVFPFSSTETVTSP